MVFPGRLSGPAPESVTEKIYEQSKQIKEYFVVDIPTVSREMRAFKDLLFIRSILGGPRHPRQQDVRTA